VSIVRLSDNIGGSPIICVILGKSMIFPMDTALLFKNDARINEKIKFLFEHQELSAILHPCIDC